MTNMIIVLVAILAITYVWTIRGFFSSLLHLACLITAGAIALAVWEPLSMWLLDIAPDRGTFQWFRDTAWGTGLAIPFVASMVILRLTVDSCVRSNVVCSPAVNSAGGAVCGLVIAMFTCGFLVMTIGFLRVGTGMWHAGLDYSSDGDGRGSLVTTGSYQTLWTDVATARFYDFVSRGTLRPISSDSLNRWYPEGLNVTHAAMRKSYEGTSRTTLRPSDVKVGSWYSILDADHPDDLDKFLKDDTWNSARQRAVMLSGEPITDGYVAGFNVIFHAGAREVGGGSQVIIGNSQVRLVVMYPEKPYTTITLHPIAVFSQAEASEPTVGRWRFDVDDFFVTSVGGAADANMFFEFAIPGGYVPKGLYVKNVRFEIGQGEKIGYEPDERFDNTRDRDRWIAEKMEVRLPDGVAIVAADKSTKKIKIRQRGPTRRDEMSLSEVGIHVTNSLGFTIQDGMQRGLDTQSDSSSAPEIIGGEDKFQASQLKGLHVQASNLRITRFAEAPDTKMVQIDAGITAFLYPPISDSPEDSTPELIDANGQAYPAVGFIFMGDSLYHIRYTPSRPLSSRAGRDIPSVSVNTPDAKLKFLFRVNNGVEIVQLRIGSKIVADFSEAPWTVNP